MRLGGAPDPFDGRHHPPGAAVDCLPGPRRPHPGVDPQWCFYLTLITAEKKRRVRTPRVKPTLISSWEEFAEYLTLNEPALAGVAFRAGKMNGDGAGTFLPRSASSVGRPGPPSRSGRKARQTAGLTALGAATLITIVGCQGSTALTDQPLSTHSSEYNSTAVTAKLIQLLQRWST